MKSKVSKRDTLVVTLKPCHIQNMIANGVFIDGYRWRVRKGDEVRVSVMVDGSREHIGRATVMHDKGYYCLKAAGKVVDRRFARRYLKEKRAKKDGRKENGFRGGKNARQTRKNLSSAKKASPKKASQRKNRGKARGVKVAR